MVWFHGGAFQSGTGFSYPGYFLASRDVIVVTVNYRLGIFGVYHRILHDETYMSILQRFSAIHCN